MSLWTLARSLSRGCFAALSCLAGPALAQQCCTGNLTTYCTAGTSVQGCLPQISGNGVPSADATSGFLISLAELPGRRFATVLYSFDPFSQPWASGSSSFLCVAPPLQRDRLRWSGGRSGACDGTGSWDFHHWRSANPFSLGAPFLAGSTVCAQGWYRDPSEFGETNLTNALRFELCSGLGGCATPPGFVAIQPGTFQMGEAGLAEPVHPVTITQSYWMGATEVTQAQYAAVMGFNPSHFQGQPSRPVEMVSWNDARTYCATLTAQQASVGTLPAGYEYRLPTEAEWEYACRAGSSSPWNVGNLLSCGDANFYNNNFNIYYCVGATSTVGSYAPNAWGLFDMHGNVWEWCLDSYGAYPPGGESDPLATGGVTRVFRGGGWQSEATYCRSAFRTSALPDAADGLIGFRVVLGPIRAP